MSKVVSPRTNDFKSKCHFPRIPQKGRKTQPKRFVFQDNEHRIATAQSVIRTTAGCGREGALPLKNPEKFNLTQRKEDRLLKRKL